MKPWWTEFSYRDGGIYVRATDTLVPITLSHTQDVLTWFGFYAVEKLRALPRIVSKPTLNLYCQPAPPRAWYLLWAAAHRCGINLKPSLKEADAAIYFEDQTVKPRTPPPFANKPVLNYKCDDISKSHVAEIFKRIFDYDLAVNPASHHGPMVRKSEHNGAHDGAIIQGPAQAEPGWVYQRVIDNTEGDNVLDLRCPTIGGTIPHIYLKRRPAGQRFANMNASCELAKTEDWLSGDEQKKLAEFCAAMHLDWGGIDVLRDKADGRIYVVDVNKTDMGPPIVLPLREKMKSTAILAKALKTVIQAKIDDMDRDISGR